MYQEMNSIMLFGVSGDYMRIVDAAEHVGVVFTLDVTILKVLCGQLHVAHLSRSIRLSTVVGDIV
jgi:hypothetical protein